MRYLTDALQGLAFWMGHRHTRFPHYPLTEGAIVAEACNLIQGNLPDSLMLYPECAYSRLVAEFVADEDLTPGSRADLVIVSKGAPTRDSKEILAPWTELVLEVKRGGAQTELINNDLRRLSRLVHLADRPVRAFLLLASEASEPTTFVKDGMARDQTPRIPGGRGYYRCRRAIKASTSFKSFGRAHYACLIEVFESIPKPMPAI